MSFRLLQQKSYRLMQLRRQFGTIEKDITCSIFKRYLFGNLNQYNELQNVSHDMQKLISRDAGTVSFEIGCVSLDGLIQPGIEVYRFA